MDEATSARPPGATPSAAGPDQHTLFEDAQAIFTAAAVIALGTGFLRQAHLLTGGITGVALLLARVTPLSFGQLLVLLNVPFLWLGLRRLGWRFTVKSFIAVLLVSFASDHLHQWVHLDRLQPVYGAVMGGFLFGLGLLMLFRHQASLGGLNVLAVYLQERHGLRAGVVQMAIDALIVIAGWFVVAPLTLALSILGALMLNLVLAVNHKPGRYLGES
jgi:uncharacterized membrane-anchored protein YitT (DUF2179 family)